MYRILTVAITACGCDCGQGVGFSCLFSFTLLPPKRRLKSARANSTKGAPVARLFRPSPIELLTTSAFWATRDTPEQVLDTMQSRCGESLPGFRSQKVQVPIAPWFLLFQSKSRPRWTIEALADRAPSIRRLLRTAGCFHPHRYSAMCLRRGDHSRISYSNRCQSAPTIARLATDQPGPGKPARVAQQCESR